MKQFLLALFVFGIILAICLGPVAALGLLASIPKLFSMDFFHSIYFYVGIALLIIAGIVLFKH